MNRLARFDRDGPHQAPRVPFFRYGVLLALAGLLLWPSAGGAQDPAFGAAAPYLEPGHWMVGALRRLDGLGLLPAGHDRGAWSVSRVDAARLAGGALDRARAESPHLVPLVEGYVARFEAEYPAAAERVRGGETGRAWGRGAAGAGVHSARGQLLTALGAPDFPQAAPQPTAAETQPEAALDLSGYGGRRWSARAVARVEGDRARLEETYALFDARPVRIWGGVREVRIGPGAGAVALADGLDLQGAGVEMGPLDLPWILEGLGPVRLRTDLGRLGAVEPFAAPWLWVLRASLQPHPRLTIGLNRVAMVAATDQADWEWVKQLAYVFIGKHSEGELNRADNQIASVDLRYRPPLGALPLALYLEWGLEDSAGAWRDVPGVVAGAYLSAVPGVPALALGVEGAHFAPSCCGNPWWYRHRGFAGGWTTDRRPLGHGLGGEGTEIAVRADLALRAGRWLAGGRAYLRERGPENLFAPTLEGSSTGGDLSLSILAARRFRISAEARVETGPGADRSDVVLQGAFLF